MVEQPRQKIFEGGLVPVLKGLQRRATIGGPAPVKGSKGWPRSSLAHIPELLSTTLPYGEVSKASTNDGGRLATNGTCKIGSFTAPDIGQNSSRKRNLDGTLKSEQDTSASEVSGRVSNGNTVTSNSVSPKLNDNRGINRRTRFSELLTQATDVDVASGEASSARALPKPSQGTTSQSTADSFSKQRQFLESSPSSLAVDSVRKSNIGPSVSQSHGAATVQKQTSKTSNVTPRILDAVPEPIKQPSAQDYLASKRPSNRPLAGKGNATALRSLQEAKHYEGAEIHPETTTALRPNAEIEAIALPESGHGEPFTPNDDRLLLELKEVKGLGWKDIGKILGRSAGSANSRYCKKLRYRSSNGRASETDMHNPARSVPSQMVQGPAKQRVQAASALSSRNLPPRDSRPHQYVFDSLPALEDTPLSRVKLDLGASGFLGPVEDVNYHNYQHENGWSRQSTRRRHRKAADANVKPYLSFDERKLLRRGFDAGEWDPRRTSRWKSQLLHMDLNDGELGALERCIKTHLPIPKRDKKSTRRAYICKVMADVAEAEILKIAWDAKEREALRGRTADSIAAFLRDASKCLVNDSPTLQRIGSIKQSLPSDQAYRSSKASLLRQRELGYLGPSRGSQRGVLTDLKTQLYDTIGPSLSFTGTSGDVGTVAWSPDGNVFAAGSTCLMDPDSMQYNRPNNLLLGDLGRKTLRELPFHSTLRERPASGVNSSHSMHVSQDPRLFVTVSMVDFSRDGQLMYSAGFDNMVYAHNVQEAGNDIGTKHKGFRHKAKVDLLAVSKHSSLLATGCKRSSVKSIKVLKCTLEERSKVWEVHSQKATERPASNITPSSLRWGIHPMVQNYLLAGFSSDSPDEGKDTSGEICLWDVSRQARVTVFPCAGNVFDCAWNPFTWSFAAASVAGGSANRGTRSVVRTFDPRSDDKFSMIMELECPALDVNDVIHSPFDIHLISVGCTNGKTYVWDTRTYGDILHTFSHGDPLMELGDFDSRSREQLDTGVRFCSWGENRTRMYTGSSDGIVKSWNVYRAPEDAFVKDVVRLNSGVMSGALSPDFTSLLLGEVNGTVNVLEVGKEDVAVKDMEGLRLVSASPVTTTDVSATHDPDSGIKAAAELLRTQQIELRPFGALPIRQAVQGCNYASPTDRSSDADNLRRAALTFQRNMNSVETQHDPCQIPLCRENGVKLTDEELGDSGRSQDRIPDALRSAVVAAPSRVTAAAAAAAAGKARCANCGLPARPRIGEDRDASDAPLCERCEFSCFRCGGRAVVDATANYVRCWRCEMEWRVNALGYSLRKGAEAEGEILVTGGDVLDSQEKAWTGDDGDGSGVDAYPSVEDYYHSLWHDRPPSPLF